MTYYKNLFLLFIFVPFLLAGRDFNPQEINPLFGPEWTFKRLGLKNEESYNGRDDVYSFEQSLLSEARNTDAPDYVVKQNKNFVYPNLGGFYFSIGTDPDVIEVRAKPSTVEEYESAEAVIQKDVFDRLKEMKIVPHSYEGGGHVHISSSVFKDHLMILRNYIVDAVNNWELGAGILGVNRSDGYGPSINYVKYNEDAHYDYVPTYGASKGVNFQGKLSIQERIAAWRAAVSSVDAQIKKKTKEDSIDEARMKSELDAGLGGTRYTAVNLENSETVEKRYLRPQKTMKQFVDFVRLDRARLRMLAKFTTPIAVRRDFPIKTKVSPQEGVKAFLKYVNETGMVVALIVTI